MKKEYDRLMKYWQRQAAVRASVDLFQWDMETAAPPKAERITAQIRGNLADQLRVIVLDRESRDLIRRLKSCGKLDELMRANVLRMHAICEEMAAVSKKENRKAAQLTLKAVCAWKQAREKEDFELFLPKLKQSLQIQKQMAAKRQREHESCYDRMLKGYEAGFGTREMDVFFDKLKKALTPLLRAVQKSGVSIPDGFLHQYYPVEKQREFAHFLASYIGFDFNRGRFGESEHPFTTAIHRDDVRISDHFYENDLTAGLFAVIHEAGHGIYEQGIPEKISLGPCGRELSMGVHESQSRFYENLIGRNKAFWIPLYGRLQECFDKQLGRVSLEEFCRAVNRVSAGPVRTRADELTYSFHILIRYELEKELISGELRPEELPQAWEKRYEKYLGIRPKNLSEGVLQDIHWAQGVFGYFPSYAIGNAAAAQLYAAMKQKLDVEELLGTGDLEPIGHFLNQTVHRYARVRPLQTLLKDASGETLNVQYYIDYLKDKYQRLYQLKESP